MAAFLSDEWLAELAEALRSSPEIQAGPRLALGQVVTGLPSAEGDDVAYTLHLGGGEPARVVPGTVDEADVVLVEGYATARAIATGTPAGELLVEGRLKVRGDVNALIAAQEGLAALSEVLGLVSVGTHFEDAADETAEPKAKPASVEAEPHGGAGE
ncbi:MAG: hypothetical protein JWM85_1853 [Acidimicrobiaceae bacterium]|nr:hypothetical protein [Acidimicrobiaceae bacterium]